MPTVPQGNYLVSGTFNSSFYNPKNQVKTTDIELANNILCVSSNGKNIVSTKFGYGSFMNNWCNMFFVSNDYGATWNYVFDHTVIMNIISPSDTPNKFYAYSTVNSQLIYYSNDAGATWSTDAFMITDAVCTNHDGSMKYLFKQEAGMYSAETHEPLVPTNGANSGIPQMVCTADGNQVLINPGNSGLIYYNRTTNSHFQVGGVYGDVKVAMNSDGTHVYITGSGYLLKGTDMTSHIDITGRLPGGVHDASNISCDKTGQYVQVMNGSTWCISTDYGETFTEYSGNLPSIPKVNKAGSRFFFVAENNTTQFLHVIEELYIGAFDSDISGNAALLPTDYSDSFGKCNVVFETDLPIAALTNALKFTRTGDDLTLVSSVVDWDHAGSFEVAQSIYYGPGDADSDASAFFSVRTGIESGTAPYLFDDYLGYIAAKQLGSQYLVGAFDNVPEIIAPIRDGSRYATLIDSALSNKTFHIPQFISADPDLTGDHSPLWVIYSMVLQHFTSRLTDATNGETTCLLQPGDVLIMKLTVHTPPVDESIAINGPSGFQPPTTIDDRVYKIRINITE